MYVSYLPILALLAWPAYGRPEVFSAVESLNHLAKTQAALATEIKTYIRKEEQRLQEMTRYALKTVRSELFVFLRVAPSSGIRASKICDLFCLTAKFLEGYDITVIYICYLLVL